MTEAPAPRSTVLYGHMAFSNKQRRDSVLSQMQTIATQRGFTPLAWSGYGAGCVTTGNTSMTFCYSHTDPDIVAQAENDLMTLLQSNQFEGDFGDQLL